MARSLVLELHPDAETMYLQVFVRAVEDVWKLVTDVDFAVTRQAEGRSWKVVSLHSSIPTLTIAPALPPPGDSTDETVDAVATGLQIMTSDEEPESAPTQFSEEALDDLRRMRRLFRYKNARLNKLVVRTDETPEPVATIRHDIARKVDRVLKGSYTIMGSLEGTVEALNVHRAPTFTIWENLTARPIRCFFDKDRWYDTLAGLTKRKARALIVGDVTYFRNGLPRYINRVRDIRDLTPDPSQPKGDFGSVPDLAGGEDEVEYIRTMRD